MAMIKKLLMCTPREAVIKIKSDEGGGSVEVDLSELCYRPEQITCNFNTEEANKIDEYEDGVSQATITCMIWAGHSQDGHGKIYRGEKDLEHQFTSYCVGDTCQLDMQGDEICADIEYCNKKLIFEHEGAVVVWLRLHKQNYKQILNIPQFGVYDDPKKAETKD